ncbi:MAG TPA: 30S ribosomal protein S16 [Candidatus Deferrimicrobiaceae bacterium]|jgi:small subunit ribosomal protein S16
MSVKIRLTRTGRTKSPSYRVIVADSRSPRDGRFIERLGTYTPQDNPAGFLIDEAATLKWLNEGAQPTETVKSLMQKAGIWKKYIDAKLATKAAAKSA